MPERAKRDVNFVPVITAVTDDGSQDVTQVRVDPTTNRLLVDSLTEEDGHASVGNGSLTITAAGKITQLSSQSCKRVWIQAPETNTGTLVVGGSSVAATVDIRSGKAFYPTQGDWFKVSNLNLLYVATTVGGDSVNWYYEN